MREKNPLYEKHCIKTRRTRMTYAFFIEHRGPEIRGNHFRACLRPPFSSLKAFFITSMAFWDTVLEETEKICWFLSLK